jgi:Ca2+-binding RTX toxin-like protein
VAATDPDAAGTAFANQRYFFWDGQSVSSVSGDGRFTIDEVSGAVFANATFDYESDVREATYQVVARDNRGDAPFHSAFTDLVIGLANVNEAPETPVLGYSAGAIAEGAGAGTVIARFTLADPDRTVPTLGPETNPGSLFTIVGDELRLAGALDFEALVALGFTVSDLDGDGRNDIRVSLDLHAGDGELRSIGSTGVSLVIEDVNEAPLRMDFTPALAAIAERDRIATGSTLPALTIGEIAVPDPDTAGFANASYSYTVDDPRFEIVGNLLRLREGVSLDFEEAEQVSVTLTATDQGVDPFTIERTLSFAVADQDDILDGTQDSNLLEGQKGRDIIHGLAGDDELRGHAGADDLHGDDGSDLILGGDGSDRLHGGSDNDRLEGGAGDDSLAGGTGHDLLLGGAGSDSIAGDSGDDVILVEEDGLALLDNIDGGGGIDTLSYRHFAAGIDADLAAALLAGDAVVGVENVEGSLYADNISGDGGANALSGLDGDDVLVGRGGGDVLVGGHGNDDLAGGAGDDRLAGGAGGDLLSGGADSDTLLGGGDGDTLLGDSGDDYLEGGAGNDIADGGAGDDSYIIDRQSHHDTIFNFDAIGGDIDVLGFKDTYGIIQERDLWFERQGDDLLVTVIGADSSVLVKNWYLEIDPGSGANHRIDFFIAGERFSRDTDVEALVELMAGYDRPADRAELDLLLADPAYEVRIATYFGINAPPVIDGVVDQRFDEGGSVVLTLSLSDDITPRAGITVTHELLSGGDVFEQGALELGPVGSDGRFTLRLAPGAHRAGTATIALTAEDASGISVTRQIVLTVDPVATTPIITQFVGGSGTSGDAAVALSLSVEFPDRDGSELHEILIAGVPSGVSLNRDPSRFDAATGLWRLRPDELAGLAVLAPAGWSQDLQLTVTARASEEGKSAQVVATTTVILNAPPTDIRFDRAVNENLPNQTVVGRLEGIDPDAGDTLTYTLIGGAGGAFALAPDGTLSVADGSKLDHEAAAAHTIRVRVKDSFDKEFERDVVIPVANVNEANRLPTGYSLAPDENLAGGTVVGQVQAEDADSAGHAFAEQHYYFRNGNALSSTSADGLYTIGRLTGLISTTRLLDHETDRPGGHSVVALDNAGAAGANQAVTTVSISLRNLNEANGLAASINLSVLENQGVGTVVGAVQASDFDSPAHPFGEQRYYFLVSGETKDTSADGRFTIDPASGEIRTTRILDHEGADASTAHIVVARDNRGATPFNQVTASLGIATVNRNEAPDAPQGSSSVLLDEVGGGNPAIAGALVASYGLSDIDGPAPTLVFGLGGNPHGLFEISGGSVRFAAGVSLTFQAARDLAATLGVNVGDADGDGRSDVRIGSVAVRASDGEYFSDEKRTDVYIEDVAQAPGAPSLASQTYHRETLAGQSPHAGQVIATFNQSDADGAIPALQIVGGNGNNWFTTVGSQLVFAANVDFSADWLRQNAAAHGLGGFSYDVDGDGLKEILVASLSLVSRDNDGLPSAPVQHEVYIEDQPEAPGFVSDSLSVRFDEGIAGHTRVGQVAGTDVDGPVGELRYGFEGAAIVWDATLARHVSGKAGSETTRSMAVAGIIS